MHLSFKKYHKAKVILEHADYKLNPELSIPFEHHSDTSDGRSPWTIGAVLSFIYERKGKREARQAEAEVNLFNKRLAIDKLALDYYKSFHAQYHTYIVSQSFIKYLENEIEILGQLLEQLQKKFELGSANQFEINTINLDLQQRKFELSLQKNKVHQSSDNILGMTQLAYTEHDEMNILEMDPVKLTKNLYRDSEWLDTELYVMQNELLNSHLDLALQLNVYAQAEAKLRLEIEKQYPDIVLSPGFIFDQSDNIWTLAASWILPLFNNSKQELEIKKALGERIIRQHEVIALQKSLLNSLFRSHNSILRYRETISASDEIIKSIETRANILKQQFELGGIDKVAILRNRIEYYRAKQRQIKIYHESLVAMRDFEHLLQHSHLNFDIKRIVALWVNTIEEKQINEPGY